MCYCNGKKHGGEAEAVSQDQLPVFGHGVLGERAGEPADLVRDADKDEGCDDDVEDRVTGQQHQDTVRVSRQPDVVLGYEQLKYREIGISFEIFQLDHVFLLVS